MHFSCVFHRTGDLQEKVNQDRHSLSTHFCLAEGVRVCLSTAGFGIILATAVSQLPVSRAESGEGGDGSANSESEFESRSLTGVPRGALKSDQL